MDFVCVREAYSGTQALVTSLQVPTDQAAAARNRRMMR